MITVEVPHIVHLHAPRSVLAVGYHLCYALVYCGVQL